MREKEEGFVEVKMENEKERLIEVPNYPAAAYLFFLKSQLLAFFPIQPSCTAPAESE